MIDEKISIEITDEVSPNIVKKLEAIGNQAEKSHTYLERLIADLKQLGLTSVNKLEGDLKKNNDAIRQSSELNKEAAQASLQYDNSIKKLNESIRRTAIDLSRTTVAEQQATLVRIKSRIETLKLENAEHRSTIQKIKLQIATGQLSAAEARQMIAIQQSKIAVNSYALSIARKDANDRRAAISTLKHANAQQMMRTAVKKTNTELMSLIRSFIIFTATLASAGILVGFINTFSELQNKLRIVAESEKQVNSLTRDIFEIANKTRSPVAETARSFERFDLALVQLGASQRETLELTETINKALIVSGANTGEQAASLLQLSQAFNKGKLDGDEFRTVMELMPPVADAIARQLNVTRGELLNLAPQGKITSQVMREAFKDARDEIDALFQKTIPTISQSITILKNRTIEFFGELERKTGVGRLISSIVLSIADNMDKLGVAMIGFSAMVAVAFGPRAIAGIEAFMVALSSNPWGLAAVGVATVAGALVIFQDDIKTTEDGFVDLGDTAYGVFSVLREDVIQPTGEFLKDVFGLANEEIRKDVGYTTETYWSEWENATTKAEEEMSAFTYYLSKAMMGIGWIWKRVANYWVGLFYGAINTIKMLFDKLPGIVSKVIKLAINEWVRLFQDGVNKLISLFNEFLPTINKIMGKVGASVPVGLKPIEIDLPFKIKGNVKDDLKSVWDDFKNIVETEWEDDPTGRLWDRIQTKARRKAESDWEASKRISGRAAGPTPPPVVKPGKQGKEKDYDELLDFYKSLAKYVEMFEDVNRDLDTQLKLLGYVNGEQAIQAKWMDINNKFLDANLPLRDKEATLIKDKIRNLHDESIIYSKLSEIYDQNLGRQVEIGYEIEANRRAYELGYQGIADYINKLKELNAEMQNLRGITGEGSPEASYIQGYMGVLENYVNDFENAYKRMGEIAGEFYMNFTDGLADAIAHSIVYVDSLEETFLRLAQTVLTEVISSFIKLAIQATISSALKRAEVVKDIAAVQAETAANLTAIATVKAAQRAAMVTTAIENKVAAASALASWSPAATAASIATMGGAAAAGKTAATVAIASSLTGFAQGGYTGNYPRDTVAGVVHGQEYVLSADDVSRIGMANIEALRRGNATVERSQSFNPTINVAPAQSQPVQNNVRIINVEDPSLISRYLNSPEGTETFVNWISENRNTLGLG